MKHILLCSSNRMLVRNLYGILRDGGYKVDTAEHPAIAVQMVMFQQFELVLMDSEPFGLSAEDARAVMRNVAPDLRVLLLNGNAGEPRGRTASPDLHQLTSMIHAIAV